MRARWREFELPTRIQVDRDSLEPTYGRFVAEPFERGFGTTVGNSIRRVLLSSLEGAAVTWVRIEGVQHEFTSMEGIVEDVTDIVLNVKELLVRVDSETPRELQIDVDKEGEVTGHDVQTDAAVEVINPDHVICTISEKRSFKMRMGCRRGRGYVTADEHLAARDGDTEIGVIPVDSIFSPVRRVRYKTEDTRVGHLTDYDKLVLEIWTDGTVEPEMALVEASKILRKHLNPFVFYYELGRELEAAEEPEEAEEESAEREELRRTLSGSIDELDLSVRASNCLEAENIKTIGDLVERSEQDLLKVRNFGKTSLREIKKKLDAIGLELGMEVGELVGA